MIKTVINNVCANTYQKDVVLTLKASTTHAPKHLISLFYTTPLMSMFLLKKQTFLSKLGNQHNYQDNTITIHEVALCYNKFDWLKQTHQSC